MTQKIMNFKTKRRNTMSNIVILTGIVGTEPESQTRKDTLISKFRLGTKDKGKKSNTWHTITAFKNTAEIVGKYVRKGALVQVVGALQYSEYETDGIKRYSTEIIVETITFLSSKPDAAEKQNNNGYRNDSRNDNSQQAMR
jgi:single-strand DNA-binding protein